jgi:hypothetical protein
MRIDNTTKLDANITFGHDRTGHETVILCCKATYDLPQSGPPTLAEDQIALLTSDVFGTDPAADAPRFENDFAPFKPKCDVLVSGRAYAPRGEPVTSLGVGVSVGQWSKKFTVHGSRIWLKSAFGNRISDRRPFVAQDISYDHAFGGTDPDTLDPNRAATYETNPVGAGYYPNRQALEGLPLPNTAEFGTIVEDWNMRHRPMAFGPLGRSWRPRRDFAGTYDDKWLESRMPFLPDDFDSRYFQAAAPDQQIPFPRGGEHIELVNLSPDGRISTTLPVLQIKVTFERRGRRFAQKLAPLDTLLFLPQQRRMCMTFRCHLATERDMFEVQNIIVHAEGAAGEAVHA